MFTTTCAPPSHPEYPAGWGIGFREIRLDADDSDSRESKFTGPHRPMTFHLYVGDERSHYPITRAEWLDVEIVDGDGATICLASGTLSRDWYVWGGHFAGGHSLSWSLWHPSCADIVVRRDVTYRYRLEYHANGVVPASMKASPTLRSKYEYEMFDESVGR